MIELDTKEEGKKEERKKSTERNVINFRVDDKKYN